MKNLIEKIHVNIPFAMLYESCLDIFLKQGLNPEIGFDADSLDTYSIEDYSGIAKQLHRRGLSITFHAPFMDLSPGSSDSKIWRATQSRFEQIIQLVQIFKPRTVVCHTGYDAKRYWYVRDLWIEKSLEMWRWFGGCLKDAGAVLMLENVYEHEPDDLEALLRRLKDQGVGFCLDTGHQAVFGRVPLNTWLESLGPYLGQLHLHDNFGEVDEHLAMGKGRIDFHILFKKLVFTRKVPPLITLEPHREEDFRPSLEYLEMIWPW